RDFTWTNYGVILDLQRTKRCIMAEVRLQIPDEFVKQLQEKLGPDVKVTDIARDALTLFNWAVGQRAKGRLVLSADDGEGKMTNMTQLTMPSLEKIKTSKTTS